MGALLAWSCCCRARRRASPVPCRGKSWRSTISSCAPISAAGGSAGGCWPLRSNGRASAGQRMSRSPCTTSTATPSASTRASVSPRRSTASSWPPEMLLIGVNRSPYTRRVAITLTAYGVAYEQKCVSGFGEREEVRAANPLGRIPALVLDDGETLIDSGAIIDHLDEVYGGDRPLTPASGADRRAVLKVAAIMMGACDKALQAAHHRNHTPVEKRHQPWVDDCTAQVRSALRAVDAMVDPA